MDVLEAPPRPDGVPDGAVWFPPANDVSALAKFDRARTDRRSHLRVSRWIT